MDNIFFETPFVMAGIVYQNKSHGSKYQLSIATWLINILVGGDCPTSLRFTLQTITTKTPLQ